MYPYIIRGHHLSFVLNICYLASTRWRRTINPFLAHSKKCLQPHFFEIPGPSLSPTPHSSLIFVQAFERGSVFSGFSWNHLFRQLFLTSTDTCYSGLYLQLAIWQLLLSKDATDAANSFNQNWRFIFFVLWTADVSSQSFSACQMITNTYQTQFILYIILFLALKCGQVPDSWCIGIHIYIYILIEIFILFMIFQRKHFKSVL